MSTLTEKVSSENRPSGPVSVARTVNTTGAVSPPVGDQRISPPESVAPAGPATRLSVTPAPSGSIATTGTTELGALVDGQVGDRRYLRRAVGQAHVEADGQRQALQDVRAGGLAGVGHAQRHAVGAREAGIGAVDQRLPADRRRPVRRTGLDRHDEIRERGLEVGERQGDDHVLPGDPPPRRPVRRASVGR